MEIRILKLPRRLAHSGPVAAGFNIAQDPSPQPLRLPGAQCQPCLEHTVTQQRVSFLAQYRLSEMKENCSVERTTTVQRTRPPSRKVPPVRSKLSRKCWALCSGFAGTSVGSASHAAHQFWLKQRVPSVAGRHGRHHIMVTQACVSALARWRDHFG